MSRPIDDSRLDDGFQIAFEDDALAVVVKPAGLLSHANQDGEDSLESRVKARWRSANLMHRLDQATSGLVLFSKRREISGLLTRMIEERRWRKAYLAVVSGEWPKAVNKIENKLVRGDRGLTINLALESEEGQRALTTFRVLAQTPSATWLEAILKTGRQHQIRAHCSSIGHPILGDSLYSGETSNGTSVDSLALHAYRMDFAHPVTKSNLKIVCAPPDVWHSSYLRGMENEPKFKSSWSALFPEVPR